MRDIPGMEGQYAVTSCGKVWSHKTNKFLAQATDKDGYKRVNLSIDGKTHRYGVHRLVALTYLENPENKPTVNHKDEHPDHNWLGNLEYATMAEQNAYGTRLSRVCRPVTCVETGVTYPSVKEAAAAINTYAVGISKVLNGRAKTHRGYHWEYASAV